MDLTLPLSTMVFIDIPPGAHLGAAVAMLETGDPVRGVVRLLQVAQETCIIDGTIDGLSPGKHSLRVHQYGDISDGCAR